MAGRSPKPSPLPAAEPLRRLGSRSGAAEAAAEGCQASQGRDTVQGGRLGLRVRL